jgi:hypothetical protein
MIARDHDRPVEDLSDFEFPPTVALSPGAVQRRGDLVAPPPDQLLSSTA